MLYRAKGASRLLLAGLVVITAGCGGKKAEDGGGGVAELPLAAAFAKAAQTSGVPERLLLATGYLESRLSPVNATANYVDITGGKQAVARGTLLTQTAFGKTLKDLGLDPAKPESSHLDVQVDAYARWVQNKLKTAGASLTAAPATPDEKFHWITSIAQMQREGLEERRNVQILFARELIQILNHGFVWQDESSGEKLELTKEPESIDVSKFPSNGQAWFNLAAPSSPIFGVSFLPLVTVPLGEFVNKPKHIEVIHCPLTLSACLELQTRTKESDVHLAAHYIIPPIDQSNDGTLNKVLQVADHKQVLILTDHKGGNTPVEDAIVIMLVGNSGRLIAGSRQPALPNWFSDLQLRAMGQLINDVCTLMAQQDSGVNRDHCRSPSDDQGVHFRYQDKSEEYRWGDIADFDPTIFAAYVKSPGGLGTEIKFDFPGGKHQFQAGDPLPLSLLFDSTARTLELERLNRCPSGKVVWEPLQTLQVRGLTALSLTQAFHDSGANRNGDQFFRIRAYGKDSHLIGWSIDEVLQQGYETEIAYASDKFCTN
ncbi:MAG: hypothetical protein NTZ90_05230 [Proteobacteria bacterium]|nr:hypothetical protein [Pseudomonadota bacterium]